MPNRKQRRAAARKKPGENYADVLAKKKLIREAVDRNVHDTSVAIEADIKTQRFMWMAVIALNEVFGFGGERARRFLQALGDVANEVKAMADEHGAVYAKAKMMERCSQITGMKISPVYEEEMRQARIENQAAGVYFPEDNPDTW